MSGTWDHGHYSDNLDNFGPQKLCASVASLERSTKHFVRCLLLLLHGDLSEDGRGGFRKAVLVNTLQHNIALIIHIWRRGRGVIAGQQKRDGLIQIHVLAKRASGRQVPRRMLTLWVPRGEGVYQETIVITVVVILRIREDMKLISLRNRPKLKCCASIQNHQAMHRMVSEKIHWRPIIRLSTNHILSTHKLLPGKDAYLLPYSLKLTPFINRCSLDNCWAGSSVRKSKLPDWPLQEVSG